MKGRTRGLRTLSIEQLRSRTRLVALLERVVADGTDVIDAAPILDFGNQDVSIGVKTSSNSSDRENLHERKRYLVQADFRMSRKALQQNQIAWHDNVMDEIAEALTRHYPGWHANGQAGTSLEPLWNDNISKYQSTQQFDYMRWD